MYRKAYLLTFDRDDNRNYKVVHDKLINLPSVITWWHYIASCYILISDTNTASKLTSEIVKVLPNKRFLLVEINLNNRNGWLPVEAWTWIKKQVGRID